MLEKHCEKKWLSEKIIIAGNNFAITKLMSTKDKNNNNFKNKLGQSKIFLEYAYFKNWSSLIEKV